MHHFLRLNGGIMRQTPEPWKAIGMSRATWYRHGKPNEKPKRFTQADVARILGVSLRTTQRDLARVRADKRREIVARARELMAQVHSEEEAIIRPKNPATSGRADALKCSSRESSSSRVQ
jgi:hypothetical protein